MLDSRVVNYVGCNYAVLRIAIDWMIVVAIGRVTFLFTSDSFPINQFLNYDRKEALGPLVPYLARMIFGECNDTESSKEFAMNCETTNRKS